MWHRCDEKMPSQIGRYLIYFQYQDAIFISYWNGEKWEQNGWLSITHWMELPSKPDNSVEVGLNTGTLICVDR